MFVKISASLRINLVNEWVPFLATVPKRAKEGQLPAI